MTVYVYLRNIQTLQFCTLYLSEDAYLVHSGVWGQPHHLRLIGIQLQLLHVTDAGYLWPQASHQAGESGQVQTREEVVP